MIGPTTIGLPNGRRELPSMKSRFGKVEPHARCGG